MASSYIGKFMLLKKLSGALALCIALGSPAVAQSQRDTIFSPSEFYAFGVSLMRDNKADEAARVANALLQRDPNDPAALILRAEAAVALSDFLGATRYARTAYYSQASDVQKFAAARLVALAQSQLKHDSRAQLWLRRARQYAPNTQAAKNVADDHRYLRDRNPWSYSLQFGVTPSSNINGGSASDNVFLAGKSSALSGIQYLGGVNAQYLAHTNATSATFVFGGASLRTYSLTDAAKLQAPEVNGSDYAFATLSFGVKHRRILSPGNLPTEFKISAGKNWYGGEAYSDTINASIFQAWKINANDTFNLSLSHAVQKRLDSDAPYEILTSSVGASWTHHNANKDRLSFGATIRQSRSASNDLADYDSTSIRADYDIAKPIAGISLGFGVELEVRDFNRPIAVYGERNDKSMSLNASFTFNEYEFYGFKPYATIDLRRNISSADFFNRDFATVGFDLRSSF